MLKKIREYCGIPQADFAEVLKMSRSHLSMAESKRREYSGNIMAALAPFAVALSEPALAQKQTDEKLQQELAAQDNDLSEWISRRKTSTAYKLQTLEANLAVMKDRQAKAIQILQVLAPIKSAAKPEHQDLYQLIGQTARRTQETTGKNSQWKLELQIHAVKAELEYLNNSGL